MEPSSTAGVKNSSTDLATLITISQQQGAAIGEMATRLESVFNQVNACLDRHDREVHALSSTHPLLASSPAVNPLSTPSASPSGGSSREILIYFGDLLSIVNLFFSISPVVLEMRVLK